MPVSVPVNASGYDVPASLQLHASPQMGHPSVSPRPASSSGMLDVGAGNGYASQAAASPLPESPTPPPPSGASLRSSSSLANRSLSPQQPTQRHNLRLAIPQNNNQSALSSHDRGNSLIPDVTDAD